MRCQWWNPEKLSRIINNNISVLIVLMRHTVEKAYIRFPYFFGANVYLWVELVIMSGLTLLKGCESVATHTIVNTHSIVSGHLWQHSCILSIGLTHSL